jgi:hypothetical protein
MQQWMSPMTSRSLFAVQTLASVGSRSLIALFLVLLLCCVSSPVQAAGEIAVITTKQVNLRAGPGLNFNEIGAAYKDERYPVLGRARGSDRIWYKITYNNGAAWVSERVVTILPSPDQVKWLDGYDGNEKTPMLMNCGVYPPLLYVGASAKVIEANGLELSKEAGLGKAQVGYIKSGTIFKVVDGPFCTRVSATYYLIQWFVEVRPSVRGYLLEGRPIVTNTGGYTPYAELQANSGNVDTPVLESVTNKRPTQATDEAILTLTQIFAQVQAKTLTQDDAESLLRAAAKTYGKDTLAWVVRRIQIYDGKEKAWVSFSRYQDQSLIDFNTHAPLDDDPVSVILSILFGSYTSPSALFDSLGTKGG